jgi:hypothetical protein
MTKQKISIYCILVLFVFIITNESSFAARKFGVIIQFTGNVKYDHCARNDWRSVHIVKYLFENDLVETDTSSSCKLQYQNDNLFIMQPNSKIKVTGQGIKLIKGDLKKIPKSDALISSLIRKGNSADSYAATSRNIVNNDNALLDTIDRVIVSPKYPELIWENVGINYAYRLHLNNGNFFDIPSQNDNVIRFKLENLQPGAYLYYIDVLKNGKVVFSPKLSPKKMICLNHTEQQSIENRLTDIIEQYGNNKFLIANFFDNAGLKVVALNHYLDFFNDQSDDNIGINEKLPLLIQIFDKFKCYKRANKERYRYNNWMTNNNSSKKYIKRKFCLIPFFNF